MNDVRSLVALVAAVPAVATADPWALHHGFTFDVAGGVGAEVIDEHQSDPHENITGTAQLDAAAGIWVFSGLSTSARLTTNGTLWCIGPSLALWPTPNLYAGARVGWARRGDVPYGDEGAFDLDFRIGYAQDGARGLTVALAVDHATFVYKPPPGVIDNSNTEALRAVALFGYLFR